jgi:hypothetical protein
VRVFNTNVFHFDARALDAHSLEWRFYTVKKQVSGQKVMQFERIVNEVTGELETEYLHVPRSGPQSRFLPVKDQTELLQRRAEIEAVARARGFFS